MPENAMWLPSPTVQVSRSLQKADSHCAQRLVLLGEQLLRLQLPCSLAEARQHTQ